MPATDTKKEVKPKAAAAAAATGAKKKKHTGKPKNDLLAPGIRRFGRNHWKRLTGRHHKFTKALKAGVKPKKRTYPGAGVSQPFNKKETRVVHHKTARVYPAESRPKKLPTAHALRPAKVRASLRPGVVAILLAGRYKGQRVVVLKALTSGLLLVTGPYKINGIPLRRVNPAYVIATSTSVDLKGVNIPASLNDEYFRKVKKLDRKAADAKKAASKSKKGDKKSEKKGEKESKQEKYVVKKRKINAQRIADQKTVDEALLKNIKAVPQLSQYLGSLFSLKNGDFPHLMKF